MVACHRSSRSRASSSRVRRAKDLCSTVRIEIAPAIRSKRLLLVQR